MNKGHGRRIIRAIKRGVPPEGKEVTTYLGNAAKHVEGTTRSIEDIKAGKKYQAYYAGPEGQRNLRITQRNQRKTSFNIRTIEGFLGSKERE